jgi:hypothetical protein
LTSAADPSWPRQAFNAALEAATLPRYRLNQQQLNGHATPDADAYVNVD